MSPATKLESPAPVVPLDHEDASKHHVTGGKGANLAKLAAAGYRVPPAIIVTTTAYSQFLAASGVREAVADLLGAIAFDDIECLESKTAEIRSLIEGADFPQSLAKEIVAAYRAMGTSDQYVAVRSSGTAEDLAGTSFAGLHDTYLDVLGPDEVIEAIKACWASLWTARATGYRERNGFDHFDALLAVVVQTMVQSDVSGVMFTGNPRTAATDETLINASWGLGEAIVQGIVTPDEYVVQSATTRVLEREVGEKEKEIVRNPATGRGVITRDVAPERRKDTALTDEQIRELTKLGRGVTTQYDGYPQDIEWALADGQLYLLQSRPITGVEFSWDVDVDAWQQAPEDPFETRTRAMADELWTGAVSPLHYSWVGPTWYTALYEMVKMLGRPDLVNRRPWKYHKASLYWDCEFERTVMCEMAPSFARAPSLERLPEHWGAAAAKHRFSIVDWLKQQARIHATHPELGPYKWFTVMNDYFTNRIEEAEGLWEDDLRALDDRELERYLRRHEHFQGLYDIDIASTGLLYYFRDAMGALQWMLDNWYDGANESAFAHVLAGTTNVTATIREHIELHAISRMICNSTQLSALFADHHGRAFFTALAEHEDGRPLRERIDAFIVRSGHRGHSDRDIAFPRYVEEPALLYSALEVHLKSDDDPMDMVNRNEQVRTAAVADIRENLMSKPLGFLRFEAFKLIHSYVIKTLELRDDEREYIDRHTFSVKRGFLEVSRRLTGRGLLETDRDHYFLAQDELFDVLHGRANMTLTRHKIASRQLNWDRFDQKEAKLPKFLYRNAGVVTEITGQYDSEGRFVMRGFGTSAGEVTGTARVIKSLSEINRVNKGEILITNSTDPGWTPVFAVLSGVIVETGGILSHSGCLAREYGFPAAHIENAVSSIPDGALITLNGQIGTVTVLDAGSTTEDGAGADDAGGTDDVVAYPHSVVDRAPATVAGS